MIHHYKKLLIQLVLFFFLITLNWVAKASAPALRFERLTIDDGLSQISVESMAHDEKGFLWIATHDGLNRFDGYEFKHFRHDPHDSSTLSNGFVTVVYKDTLGQLWAGTKVGLNRYIPETQSFVRYLHDSEDPNSLSHNNITSITQDHNGTLWVGTLGGGLNYLDGNKFKHIQHDPKDPGSLSDNMVHTIVEDQHHILWVGTYKGGLNRLDPVSRRFKHYKYQADDPNSLSHNSVYALSLDQHPMLWVGTFGGGLNRFNTQTEQFERFETSTDLSIHKNPKKIRSLGKVTQGKLWIGTDGQGLMHFNIDAEQFIGYRNQASDPFSLSQDSVLSIYQDQSNLLWIGTLSGGMNLVSDKPRHFGHFKHRVDNPRSLNSNTVMAIFVDSKEALWVGTWGGGLNRQKDKDSGFEHWVHDANLKTSLSSDSVWSITEDQNNTIWIGTKGGLNRYDPNNNDFVAYQHNPNDPNSLSHDWITDIIESADGKFWIATRGGGLNLFDRNNETFTHFRRDKKDPNSISSDYIMDLTLNDDGTLWLATWGGGLNYFDPKTSHFRHFKSIKDDPKSLSDNYVLVSYTDDDGTLWIGTFGGGLNRYDSQKQQFKHYREKEGLPNDTVYAMAQDREKNLWLATNNGLARLNIYNGRIKHFNAKDGLQSNEFNGNAYFRNHDGELFFGGVNGFNRFYAKQIKENKQPPKVVFTELLLFNQKVSIDNSTQTNNQNKAFKLTQAIEYLPQLTLSYRENLVAFEFAAFDYHNPIKNQYAYQLVGQDEDWIYTDAKSRRATYTNLSAGEYTLRVKASNSDGYWNEQGKSLKLIVTPPPWKTWWAYSLYSIIVIGLMALFVHQQRRKVRYQQEVNRHLKQIDQLKDEFLANTSHELRTPLNGIIGLAESLMDGIAGQLPEKAHHNLSMVVSSGKRLSNLINDVLDFSKLKNSNLTLHPQPVDLHSMVEVVLTLTRPLLTGKDLTLVNEVSRDIPSAMADENRLEQILHNLVGNAIKFTESGQITIGAEHSDNDKLLIKVTDTGIGIDKADFDNLFEMFTQVEGQMHKSHRSTGLGLSVSKQLVELHGGTLMVESTVGVGSTFSFNLPVSVEKITEKNSMFQTSTKLHQFDDDKVLDAKILHPQESNDPNSYRILLVDDEPINRQVLHDHLSLQNYQLVEATGGEQALRAINNQGPFDLVLLDIMMPHISGFEVCSILRDKYSANDLPVIFLTAKNQVSDMVEGFSVGANDYLSKPVNKYELLTRVENHLKFLESHRDLESKVAERTEQLQQKTQLIEQKRQELETKNKEIEHKHAQLEAKAKQVVETQQQLVQAEKMASLGTLTAGVAHELNNPNNFIHISVQNLKNDLKKTEDYFIDLAKDEANEALLEDFRQQFIPLDNHLNIIKDGAKRIKDIVLDLYTFSQLDAAELQTVDICELIQVTVNLARTRYQKSITFDLQIPEQLKLHCNPAQLNQVFMNFIVNGCEAIEHKNSSDHKGQITIECEQFNQHIEINIKDNGCGMTAQTQNKLFEPFYTTKTVGEGTGLGLSIAFGIIQQHGGEISVESMQNIGSNFTIKLPFNPSNKH